MSGRFAEVIGDPVAQTRSPSIHRYWLSALGLSGDYCATPVRQGELAEFLDRRRRDPDWLGCNVTIPHKQPVLALLDRVEPGATAIGAVNCILPGPHGLEGRNTDIDGVAAALGSTALRGRKATLIGAGGGARAAIRYLLDAGAAETAILVRDPAKGATFDHEARLRVYAFEECDAALEGAAAIVNATPLGMTGAPAMPGALLAAVARHARGATLLDMVYDPLETPFLAAGRAGGGSPVDGLVMLIGQARAAFRHFFRREPPSGDEALRASLIG
jgi:shikimate dehydrogenase